MIGEGDIPGASGRRAGSRYCAPAYLCGCPAECSGVGGNYIALIPASGRVDEAEVMSNIDIKQCRYRRGVEEAGDG